ncbi:MAG: glycosyltransferase family 4 protein [Nitrospirota bacterium]
MRILFYASSFLPTVGGAEIMLHNLASSLSERGHKVAVLAPHVRGADNKIDADYRLIRYQRPSSKRFLVRQVLPWLVKERLLHGVDVLHCHGAYTPGYVGASFKAAFKTPLVIRPHGADILPGEHIMADARLSVRAVKALRAADKVVAQTAELKGIVTGLGVDDGNVVIIPNGVRTSDYDGAAGAEPSIGRYVLALGSLTRKKGFDLLINAMAIVAKEDAGVMLLIAGEGQERKYLERLVLSLGLQGRVVFTGIISGQEKIDAVKGCKFGVSSSRREPFSNSNLEFLAAGKPLVATRVGGNVEVVKDGLNGFLVEPEDPQALAGAMVKVLKDERLRQTMGENSKKEAARFEWDKIVDMYEKLYQSLMVNR